MLSKEQLFFISVLSDYLNETKTVPNADLDISTLATIAKQQQCEGILYYQTHLPQLKSSFASQSYYAVNRRNLLKKIHEVFAANNIPYLIFKGSEVADVMPVASLRSMGDSDVMVRPKDKERAHKLLLSLGFVNENFGPNEWSYRKNDMEFELHSRLMNEELVSLESHNQFMSRVWEHATSDDGIQFHLDWNYHLAFLLLHLRKHFMNSGVGFRQFMDVAAVSKNCEINWNEFKKTIEELQIIEFVSICYGFIKRWFGIEFSFETVEIDETFYEIATQQIFENGVFGFNDAGNKENYTVIQMRNNGNRHEHTLSKIKLFLQSCFPSYRDMSGVPKYSFIKHYPYLLPIAWVYRFIYSLIHGTSQAQIKSLYNHLSVTKEQVNDRTEYLKNWKLM